MRHLRQLLGRSGWPQAEKRRIEKSSRSGQKRRLISELLERRELLAGDILASSYHNASMPTDVDANQQVTPLDALMVINYLSQPGAGVQGEQISGFVDVNDDGQVSASDALMVINELNRLGEGAGDPVIELQLRALGGDANGDILSSTTNGDGTRVIDVSVGQVFDLEISYLDLRGDGETNGVPDRRGVFQLVSDIKVGGVGITDPGSFVVPLISEAQQLSVGSELETAFPDSTLLLRIELTDADGDIVSTNNIDILADAFVADPAGTVAAALPTVETADGVAFTADDFEIIQIPGENTPGGTADDFVLQVRFKGADKIGQDQLNVNLKPRIQSGTFTFPLDQAQVPHATREFAVTNGLPDPPDNIDYSLDFASRSIGQRSFYSNTGARGVFNPSDPDQLFNEIRGLGSTSIVPDVTGADENTLNDPFDSYSIPIFIKEAVNGLEFSVNMGEDAEAILIYGFLDPSTSQDGLVAASATFGTSTEINVVATTAGEEFNGVRILFNGGGAGDVAPTAAYDTNSKEITVTYNSQAATVANRSYNAIAAAINGLAAFDADVVTGGDGAAAFVEPASTPELAGGGEPRSIVTEDRLTLDEDARFIINALPIGSVQQPGVLGFATASASIDEDAGTVTLTVNRTSGSDGEVTVNYATADGSAAAGSDYTAKNGTLTFAEGVTSQTIVIDITNDSEDEPDQDFTVTLSVPGGGATLGTDVATVTIVDDDEPVVVPGSLALADAAISVNEGAGTATFTINRSGGSDGSVSVTYATSNGTATAGEDYTAVNQSVTFAAGETTKTVMVAITDDAVVENDETFTLTLSAPTNGATLGTVTTSTATIIDNDNPTPVPGVFVIAPATVTVDEDAGTVQFTVNRTTGSDGAVSVGYATMNGTATAGEDYTAASATLDFADGETSKIFTVAITDDSVDESDETFSVTLSNPTNGASLGAVATSTVTIADNDEPVLLPGVLSIDPAATTVNEDAGTVTFTVNRTAGSDGIVTVAYATANGTATAGADYTATSGTLNFAAGETSKMITVPILDDTVDESSETFTVTISNPTGGATLGATQVSTVTITDNDEPVLLPGVLSIDPAATTVNEDAGTVTFTVNRTAGSDGIVTVAFATANGTATAGADYTATSGTLNFAAGETSKMITVPILDDTVDESSETFTVTISNPTGGATLGATQVSTVTITDNDEPAVVAGVLSISPANRTVDEDSGTATFTVTRTGGSDGVITVKYATANGTATAGADYTATSGTLEFADGETSKSFTVPILEDAIDEPNETFTVTISDPTGGASLGTAVVSTATIIDNDVTASPGEFTISPATRSVDESGPTISFTVTRTGGSDGAVSVSYATSDGSATAGADYTAKSDTLDFADGETSKTITINILEDTIDEPNETFRVTLSSPTDGATLGTATVSTAIIVDNDDAPIGTSTISGSIFIDQIENLEEVTESLGAVEPVRDGEQDADERGLVGVLVELRKPSGEVVASALTDANGAYEFTGVPEGSYVLTFGVSSDNVFLAGTNEVPVTVGAATSVVPGNLAVYGTAGALGSVDILASSYLRNNEALIESSDSGRRGGVVSLDGSGNQIFLMAADGFDSVEYIEVLLNSTRDKAIMTIVDNGEVLSAVLSKEEFVVNRAGTALQFFGGYDDHDDFGFAGMETAGSNGFSQAAVDALFARAEQKAV
ncbi:Calx-beta domain-containing protein [Novipirellula artificiosorum]|uniref:Serine-aspartate repeat-containing protein D n=1 Tax=Novipirellula artificiosorum TaxID=2528016 RepID=A0A5C6E008_9BACT|nr:Calx-beta domain-containing protein [Novipirellula artificiosorum]TWU42045.1 Serine-aspartate repeat-containing protein D precursor [Novipirellula artificiosorum]